MLKFRWNLYLENKIVYKLKGNLKKSKQEFIEKIIESYMSHFQLEKHNDGALYKKNLLVYG